MSSVFCTLNKEGQIQVSKQIYRPFHVNFGFKNPGAEKFDNDGNWLSNSNHPNMNLAFSKAQAAGTAFSPFLVTGPKCACMLRYLKEVNVQLRPHCSSVKVPE